LLPTAQLSCIVVKNEQTTINTKNNKKITHKTLTNFLSQNDASNESLGADVNTNVEPVKNESVEKQEAETERRKKSTLVNQSVPSETSNVVEYGQVTPAGTSGK